MRVKPLWNETHSIIRFVAIDVSQNRGHKELDTVINYNFNRSAFSSVLKHLQSCFDVYLSTCPVPLISTNLIVTTEIRYQSELYLPLSDIIAAFHKLYQYALKYPPILSSTPFSNALSWADLLVSLPPQFQFSANPATLLQQLLTDQKLLTSFLFYSFLPKRFYGGFRRYPKQLAFINSWLGDRKKNTIRCLDAACGTGEDTYTLARLIAQNGFYQSNIEIEGWTLEPLEVWSASKRCFPHDPNYEKLFNNEISDIGEMANINFSSIDLTIPSFAKPFDLIICNGLLGGPIIHQQYMIEKAVANLTCLLRIGGILLIANHFHGGWKQHCPQHMLQAVLKNNNLCLIETGEGVGGLKLHQ